MNKLIIVKQYFINILKIDNRSCRLLLLYMLAVCEVQPSAPRTEMVLNEEPSSARRLSDNARALAKFERPKNACVFEGARIWLSPHGRARHRPQLAWAKPEEPPRGGGDAALTRLLDDGPAASCLKCYNFS